MSGIRCVWRFWMVVLWSLVLGGSAAPPTQLRLPVRPANALTGTQLRDALTSLSREEREAFLYEELVKGNVPEFLRTLFVVKHSATVAGRHHTIVFAVSPDYLAFGSDADFFRMPMTPGGAERICDYLDCSLPTRKLVDIIRENSEWKLTPQPIPPSPEMVSVDTFYAHHTMIEKQRSELGVPLGHLLSGIKKDVVITPQLFVPRDKPRVAIYGWHYPNGTPIQPLSLVHEASYVDYSHGIRLIGNDVVVDGTPMRLHDVLSHPQLSALVSDEGAFVSGCRYPTPSVPTKSATSKSPATRAREYLNW